MPARTDNQEENLVEPSSVDTQEKDPIVAKTEPAAEVVVVKLEPGTQSQVITADFFRRFLEAGLVSEYRCYGLTTL